MKITKIQKQKLRNNRYNIFVDESYLLSLSESDLLKEKIATGDDLNEKRIEQLKFTSKVSLLFDKSLIFLSSRPHSKQEITQYLKKKVYSLNKVEHRSQEENALIANEVMKMMENSGYINDYEFAHWFAEQRKSQKNKKGAFLVKQELMSKGINNEIIKEVISTFDKKSELENASHIAQKKLKSAKGNEYEKKQKVTRYLISKGYTYDTARDAVDSVITQT